MIVINFIPIYKINVNGKMDINEISYFYGNFIVNGMTM